MRYLFFGIFILSLISGLIAFESNHPTDGRPGLLGVILEGVGLKQQEQRFRQGAKASAESSKEAANRSRQVIEQIAQQQDTLMQNVKDQQQFLKDSNQQIDGIGQMINALAEKSGTDMLRIKQMMADFQAQNRLLIERGNELLSFNQEQLKIRQQSLDDASLATVESGLQQQRFLQQANEAFLQRSDFINKSAANVTAIREGVERTMDKLKSLENNLTTKEDAQLLSNLTEAKERTRLMLEKIRLNQQHLHDAQEFAKQDLLAVKEKNDDYLMRQKQLLQDSKDHVQQQADIAREHVRDQLQRLQDQRNH